MVVINNERLSPWSILSQESRSTNIACGCLEELDIWKPCFRCNASLSIAYMRPACILLRVVALAPVPQITANSKSLQAPLLLERTRGMIHHDDIITTCVTTWREQPTALFCFVMQSYSVSQPTHLCTS